MQSIDNWMGVSEKERLKTSVVALKFWKGVEEPRLQLRSRFVLCPHRLARSLEVAVLAGGLRENTPKEHIFRVLSEASMVVAAVNPLGFSSRGGTQSRCSENVAILEDIGGTGRFHSSDKTLAEIEPTGGWQGRDAAKAFADCDAENMHRGAGLMKSWGCCHWQTA